MAGMVLCNDFSHSIKSMGVSFPWRVRRSRGRVTAYCVLCVGNKVMRARTDLICAKKKLSEKRNLPHSTPFYAAIPDPRAPSFLPPNSPEHVQRARSRTAAACVRCSFVGWLVAMLWTSHCEEEGELLPPRPCAAAVHRRKVLASQARG